jgi:hypothetical protein
MGYLRGVKGYRVRDAHTGSFFNSMNVIFDENFWVKDDDDCVDPAANKTDVKHPISGPIRPATPPGQIRQAPHSPPPRERSRCVKVLTEGGREYQKAISATKALREKLAEARRARLAERPDTECAAQDNTSGGDPVEGNGGVQGRDLSEADNSGDEGHVFADDHVNLICEESALLSIHSDTPHSLISPSYDMKIPPATYSEAKQRPDAHIWDKAVIKELNLLKTMGVYTLTQLPPGRKAIGNRWVFEFKIDGDDLVPKGRLVAKGFHQIPGIDFGKTFAPVAKAASIRMLAAIACREDWDLDCFDATRAFLWGDLDEELYMRLPDGFELSEDCDRLGLSPDGGTIMRLWKSIYELKQASRVWYQKFSGVLERLGLQKSATDHALFSFSGSWRGEGVECLLAIHVDDGMGGSNSRQYLDWVKAGVLKEFGLKDLGAVRTFLGVSFEHSRTDRQLWLHQEDYIHELLKDYNLTECNPVSTPMDHELPFGRPGETFPNVPNVRGEFQALMGRLLFLALFSQPDITYAVNRLAQHNANPEARHFAAAKRLLRYLKGTKSLRLHYRVSSGTPNDKNTRLQNYGGSADLVGFSDSDWAGKENRVSVSGYAWFLSNGLIDWSTRKQRTVALSSTEAEYMALSMAVQNGLWLRASMDKIGRSPQSSITICGDNLGSISLATNSSQHSRSEHIDVKFHFIREHVNAGTFKLNWIPRTQNTADILTKPLNRVLHNSHVAGLGLVPR